MNDVYTPFDGKEERSGTYWYDGSIGVRYSGYAVIGGHASVSFNYLDYWVDVKRKYDGFVEYLGDLYMYERSKK